MKYYRYIKIILILIPIMILGVLAYKDICPSGILKVDYDFCREDPFISKFSPMGRVLEIKKNKGECQQEMIIDPVYFDVRLPHGFKRAKIILWYKKNSETPLKIGPRLHPDKWQWDLKDIRYIRQDGDWKVGIAEIDLSRVKMDRNRVRFLISSPGLDKTGEKIIFDRLEIEFYDN